MVWLALAPTWNWLVPKLPSSRRVPLNSVVWAIRSRFADPAGSLRPAGPGGRWRCWRRWPTGRQFAHPLQDVGGGLEAPSVVCASEMPSLALRTAWFRPRIWALKRSEMARPAASSLALLMRRPDDRRWMAVDSEAWLVLEVELRGQRVDVGVDDGGRDFPPVIRTLPGKAAGLAAGPTSLHSRAAPPWRPPGDESSKCNPLQVFSGPCAENFRPERRNGPEMPGLSP